MKEKIKKYKSQLREYFNNILLYKNHSIYDVEHSVARFKERMPLLGTPVYFNLLKKGIDWIIKNNKEKIEDRYIFISKKHGFGIQVEWRKDRYKNVFNGYSATTFSDNEMNFFTKADKEVFLENFKSYSKFIESKATEDELREVIDKDYYSYIFKADLKEEVEFCNMNFFIEKGKIYYSYELIKL